MTRRRIFVAACLIAVAAVALWFVLRPARSPNILLVTIDTLRADHCSAYGYARDTTPSLDRLAREGVLFEHAYTPMATTAPSHASMMTGLQPRSHGLLKNGYVLRAELATLAETLLDRGYQTAAFVSSYVLNRSFGLAQGFETYDDDFVAGEPSGRTVMWDGHPVPEEFSRPANVTRAQAVAWLEQHGQLAQGGGAAPFFLWVHLFEPHYPYTPPPEHRFALPPNVDPAGIEGARAAYDGEVRFADAELGQLVDALRSAGRLDDTLVIVLGDHGEGLMDHGHMFHGLHVYEEAMRVPLVLRWPERLLPHRAREPVAIVDLARSVLALVALDASSHIAGEPTLLPQLTGGVGDPDAPVFLERREYEVTEIQGIPVKGLKRGLRKGRFKYIEAPEEGAPELYDLALDPRETRNLQAQQPQLVRELSALLGAWVQRTQPAPKAEYLSDEAAERLRSLGYTK